MDELVEWLRAQLDEDERIARSATPGPWVANKHEYGAEVYTESGEGVALDHDAGGVGWGDADFIAANDPARVLREIDAKRRIIGRINSHSAVMGWDEVHGDLLRSLALPYADRHGYKESWRP